MHTMYVSIENQNKILQMTYPIQLRYKLMPIDARNLPQLHHCRKLCKHEGLSSISSLLNKGLHHKQTYRKDFTDNNKRE